MCYSIELAPLNGVATTVILNEPLNMPEELLKFNFGEDHVIKLDGPSCVCGKHNGQTK